MSKIFTIAEGIENMGALRTGGQGSVYKGRRIGPMISAVKLLPTPIHVESREDKNYCNFINEVEKLKKVNEIPNPNIVKMLSFGITESGSLPFIEMEFIEGPDLEELLRPPHEKIFIITEVIKLAEQLACALSHCHKVGVKHGDIKSNNVKFNNHSGNYVLLDFGLSIMSDEQRRSSIRHAGAIEFMAPEQHEGKILFQTDIYSYGIILYELLTGQVPFILPDNGESARNAVMLSHLEKPVPDLLGSRKQNLPAAWSDKKQDRETQVPAWLLQLVAKCLEKSPDDRYSNGVELHEAIVDQKISGEDNEALYSLNKLKAENRQLQEELACYKKGPPKDSKIILSRPFFIALLTVLIAAVCFGVLKNSHSSTEPGKTDPASSVAIFPQSLLLKKQTFTISKSPTTVDSVKPDSQKSRLTVLRKKKVHKKRKKFLGIF